MDLRTRSRIAAHLRRRSRWDQVSRFSSWFDHRPRAPAQATAPGPDNGEPMALGIQNRLREGSNPLCRRGDSPSSSDTRRPPFEGQRDGALARGSESANPEPAVVSSRASILGQRITALAQSPLSMDLVDLVLCQKLQRASRLSYRELGRQLGLSTAAVHARIQALRTSGVIRSFTARISLAALGATNVIVWGESDASSNPALVDRVRQDDRVYWIAFAGGGILYVGAYLRSGFELDPCVARIMKGAAISRPNVGIIPMGRGLPEKPVLGRVDSRILLALHADSRRSLTGVAREARVSPKTVGRRLGRMVRDRQAEFSLEWYPDDSSDIMTMWHLQLRPGADRESVLARLQGEYAPNLLYPFVFSNLPGLWIVPGWTSTMKELKGIEERLRSETWFERVVPNVMYSGRMFDTWRDRLLVEWAAPLGRPGARPTTASRP